MEETATMPSYFPSIKSSESHPLADWLYLKSVITSSPELRMMTETYRKRLAISKQFADQCISPLQRPHYFTSSYTYLFSKKVILLSFLGWRIA